MSGALTNPPSKVVRQLMVDLSLGTLPSAKASWPISISQEMDSPNVPLDASPDAVITVYDTAGRITGRNMIDGVMQEHYGIQIRIRNANYQDAYTKAKAIQNAIDSSVSNAEVTVSSSVYLVAAITRTSSILSLGKEPTSRRNLLTINAVVAIRQTT